VVILDGCLLVARRVFGFDFPLQALWTTAASTLELFIGVEAGDEQTSDFVALKSLVAFEGFIGQDQMAAQILQIHALGRIVKNIIGYFAGPADPSLPAGTSGLRFQLQKAGHAHDRPKHQA
jgi:hypothetical protein